MEQVGILTYHFAINYGAALQCYALKKAVERLGYRVWVIQLVTEEQERNNSLFRKRKGIKNLFLQVSLLPFLRERKEKWHRFHQFAKRNFNYTESCREADFQTVVRKCCFDTVICGSDQVWNPYIDDFTKKFFLPGDLGCKKIGYAVSLGKAGYEELKGYEKEVRDFKKIGVREKSKQKDVERLAGRKVFQTVDPTFLLAKEDWEALAESGCCLQKRPYLVCYFLKKENFSKTYKIAGAIARKRNLKVVYINQRFSPRSFYPGTVRDAGPEDFVSLIQNADYVCTDSYHGMLFALLFEKEFSVFVDSSASPDTRKQDMLRELDLMERCVWLDAPQYTAEPIQYEVVREKADFLRRKSEEFLKTALESEK